MVRLFFQRNSYGSSNGQAGIILNGFQFLVKKNIICLIIKNITIIKMGLIKTLYIVISASLGKTFCNLRRRTIVLLIFRDTILIWSSNFDWLSSKISQCFWEDDLVTLTSLSSSGGWPFFQFASKNGFLSLFSSIWIKFHFSINSTIAFSF